MLAVEKIFKRFGSQWVIKNVSFTLASGEIVGIVGPSGGGKSVLLKLIASVIPVDSGKVSFPGILDGAESRARFGVLFQEGALFDSMNVLENVAFPLQVRTDYMLGALGGERKQCDYDTAVRRAYDALEEVGLGHAYRKLPGQLSGGMRRRVALARAIVGTPSYLLLDDPTGGLDPVAASVIIALIKKLHAYYNPTIILVSHDIRRLLPNVDRVIGLFDGQIECDVPTPDLLKNAPTRVIEFLRTRFDFDQIPLTHHAEEQH